MEQKTIESFVTQLQTEGVEAGESKAREITDCAEQKAKQIVADAEKNAAKIIEDAEKEASDIKVRANTEMALASRDTLAKLRESLTNAMKNIVATETSKALSDNDFLKDAILEIVKKYAESDIIGKAGIELNVNAETQANLEKWVLAELSKAVAAPADIDVTLKAELDSTGFEYMVAGGTVEITVESVAEAISDMVSPAIVKALKS